jgi:aspartate/tyrosine/aromatic aminotransferase
LSSPFSGVPLAPPDPILGINDAFKACSSPDKLNLGVGAYRDEDLKPVVLQASSENAELCLRTALTAGAGLAALRRL